MPTPDNLPPLPQPAPQPIDASRIASLTAASIASGLDAARRLRALGVAVIDMAHAFNQSCEAEAAAIELSTEQFSAKATSFANTVLAQGTKVNEIEQGIEELHSRPRIVAVNPAD